MSEKLGDILIADAGSTKTDWIVADSSGNILSRQTLNGINVTTQDPDVQLEILQNAKKAIPGIKETGQIFFYAAGCNTAEKSNETAKKLQTIWGVNNVSVYSDLLGAARALFGNRKGIACILGTGSNSCFYNGKEIIKQIPSLGYILGDEGSGTALGKRLINALYKEDLSEEIKDSFEKEYHLNLPVIIDKTYRSASPNSFLSSFSPFIKKYENDPKMADMITEEFKLFFDRNVCKYKETKDLEIKITGSIALHFKNFVKKAASLSGLKINEIVPYPIDRLIEFHLKNES